MATKLHGKYLEIVWTKTGGSALTISPKSRSWKATGAANSIDVSTRDDILAGQKDKLVDAPDRKATLSGLDTDENSPDWLSVEIDDTGMLREYRRTSASGRAYREWSARVSTAGDIESPHDGVNSWTIEWELTTAPSSGIVS